MSNFFYELYVIFKRAFDSRLLKFFFFLAPALSETPKVIGYKGHYGPCELKKKKRTNPDSEINSTDLYYLITWKMIQHFPLPGKCLSSKITFKY